MSDDISNHFCEIYNWKFFLFNCPYLVKKWFHPLCTKHKGAKKLINSLPPPYYVFSIFWVTTSKFGEHWFYQNFLKGWNFCYDASSGLKFSDISVKWFCHMLIGASLGNLIDECKIPKKPLEIQQKLMDVITPIGPP